MTQELYALSANRSAAFVKQFLDKVVPSRERTCEEYPVPESSDQPKIVFRSDLELLGYLERHPNEPYGIYWNDATAGSSAQAMVFFTRDGMIIFGLADKFQDPERSLTALGREVGANY